MAAVVAPSRSRGYVDRRWVEVGLWVAMVLGLALCYIGQTPLLISAGLLLLGALALLRPDLALLLIPLSAPLFLTPLTIPRSGRQLTLPPHELALLVSAAATFPHLLARGLVAVKEYVPNRKERQEREGKHDLGALGAFYGKESWSTLRLWFARFAPEMLLLIGGVAGVWMAVPEPQARADALRAFRWFVAEPLIFVALIRLHAHGLVPRAPSEPLAQARRLLYMFVLGGAGVALVGLFQLASYLLHARIEPATFATGVGLLGGIQRVTSVYGNPNNMALYLGRVWPMAAMLGIANFKLKIANSGKATQSKIQNPASKMLSACFYLLVMLLCLAGIIISLSRGAWLGAGAALLVLLLPAARARFGGRQWPIALIAGAVLVAVAALIFGLRGGVLDGSADVRLLFWRESLKLLEVRPLGLGLDQFLYYHDPAYGRSMIDPALATTQDRYAHQPHNLFFEIWFNLGPLGVAAFGWLLARCLRQLRAGLRFPARATRLLAHGALAALAAALVHGLVDSFYFWPDIAIAFWLLVGVSELIGRDDKMTR